MHRIRLHIGFDGSDFAGWQRQDNARTIQGEIEKCLGTITGSPVAVHGVGRTDAGVHARGMVAHFDIESRMPVAAFERGLNSMLSPAIRIKAAVEVSTSFHARYSSVSKVYSYCFSVAAVMEPVRRLYCAQAPGLDHWSEMNECLDLLPGEHDFTAFEATGSRDRSRKKGRGGYRRILRAVLEPSPYYEQEYIIWLQGDGFLRKMVRNIAGTVFQVGRGKMTVEDFAELFVHKDRKFAGPTAPACGLFLEKVYYDHDA